jgi:hypothetical protein
MSGREQMQQHRCPAVLTRPPRRRAAGSITFIEAIGSR